MTEEEPTPQQVLQTLSEMPSERYEKMDRYRDFRAVFLGSEQGRRVLNEILGQCGVNRTSVLPGGVVDPHRVTFLEGRRSVGTTILGIMHNEPTEQPARANSVRGE